MGNNQGKAPQQYKDSITFLFLGYVGIILIVSVILLGVLTPTTDNKENVGDCDTGEMQLNR